MLGDLSLEGSLVGDIEGDGGGVLNTLGELLSGDLGTASCNSISPELRSQSMTQHTNGDGNSLLGEVVETGLRNETGSQEENALGGRDEVGDSFDDGGHFVDWVYGAGEVASREKNRRGMAGYSRQAGTANGRVSPDSTFSRTRFEWSIGARASFPEADRHKRSNYQRLSRQNSRL